MIKMMFAAPGSGSGKTTITTGMLALLKKRGLDTRAFKCGPDYIDPMFHRAVLGINSHNMDLFMMDKDAAASHYKRYTEGADAVVFEGVMGFYDGVGGTTTEASSWHTADTFDVPVILVINVRGAGLTTAALIKGMRDFRENSRIKGVILNQCSEMLFKSMKSTIEKESGVPVLGYMPRMEDIYVESRYLGLYTAGEIEDINKRIDRIAEQLEKSLDMERLFEICSVPETVKAAPFERPEETAKVKIAVASDKAFCFDYQENLDCLTDLGAEIVFFSPITDSALPEGVSALYLPGGYPELYAKELNENKAMRLSIKNAVLNGLPTMAECGGFMYLCRDITDPESGVSYEMAGVLPGHVTKKDRLVRFGYQTLTAKEESLLFEKGGTASTHEFHYWDSDSNGSSLTAEKPVSGRSWECAYTGPTIYAGFPHLYFPGCRKAAERFVKKAAQYGMAGAS